MRRATSRQHLGRQLLVQEHTRGRFGCSDAEVTLHGDANRLLLPDLGDDALHVVAGMLQQVQLLQFDRHAVAWAEQSQLKIGRSKVSKTDAVEVQLKVRLAQRQS